MGRCGRRASALYHRPQHLGAVRQRLQRRAPATPRFRTCCGSTVALQHEPALAARLQRTLQLWLYGGDLVVSNPAIYPITRPLYSMRNTRSAKLSQAISRQTHRHQSQALRVAAHQCRSRRSALLSGVLHQQQPRRSIPLGATGWPSMMAVMGDHHRCDRIVVTARRNALLLPSVHACLNLPILIAINSNTLIRRGRRVRTWQDGVRLQRSQTPLALSQSTGRARVDSGIPRCDTPSHLNSWLSDDPSLASSCKTRTTELQCTPVGSDTALDAMIYRLPLRYTALRHDATSPACKPEKCRHVASWSLGSHVAPSRSISAAPAAAKQIADCTALHCAARRQHQVASTSRRRSHSSRTLPWAKNRSL